jgi:hypothetical protein
MSGHALAVRRRLLVIPTMDGLWALAAVVPPVAGVFVSRVMAIDLGYQIRAGAMMLDTHRILDVETFTFTMRGEPWLNQQWGAELLLALIYRVGGWGGIAVVRGLLVAVILTIVYRTCRASGATPRKAAVLTLGGWVVGFYYIPQMRPQIFAILLFALVMWIVATRNVAPRRLWWVPALTILWVNLHGSFPLIFVLLGLAWLEDRRQDPGRARRILLVALASVVLSLANPFGFGAWIYALDISTNANVVGQVIEWGPPSIYTPTGFFFFASLIAVGGLLARRPRKTTSVPLLSLAVFACIGFIAIRGVVWWAVVAPVVIAGLMAEEDESRDGSRPPSHLVLVGAFISLLVITFPWGRDVDPATGGPAILSYAPGSLVSAADAVSAPGTHAFVSGFYSSWTELSAPSLPVAVDARIELFTPDVWTDYFIVADGREGWDQVLERWEVGVLILEPTQADGLLAILPDHPEWRLVARNASGAVYARA